MRQSKSQLICEGNKRANCYGQAFQPYPTSSNFSSFAPSICQSTFGGLTTAVGAGDTWIQGGWTADSWFMGLNEQCEYTPLNILREALCEVLCTSPAGESSSSGGWDTLDPTVHRWNQTLTGSNFSGRTVTEQQPGAGASDTCYFTGSAYDPAALSGGTWPVNSSNQWGPDLVGWFPGQVSYYRAQGRAPCSATIPQEMLIDCPRGPILYVTNTIGGDINATTVVSRRAGSTVIRTWP